MARSKRLLFYRLVTSYESPFLFRETHTLSLVQCNLMNVTGSVHVRNRNIERISIGELEIIHFDEETNGALGMCDVLQSL